MQLNDKAKHWLSLVLAIMPMFLVVAWLLPNGENLTKASKKAYEEVYKPLDIEDKYLDSLHIHLENELTETTASRIVKELREENELSLAIEIDTRRILLIIILGLSVLGILLIRTRYQDELKTERDFNPLLNVSFHVIVFLLAWEFSSLVSVLYKLEGLNVDSFHFKIIKRSISIVNNIGSLLVARDFFKLVKWKYNKFLTNSNIYWSGVFTLLTTIIFYLLGMNTYQLYSNILNIKEISLIEGPDTFYSFLAISLLGYSMYLYYKNQQFKYFPIISIALAILVCFNMIFYFLGYRDWYISVLISHFYNVSYIIIFYISLVIVIYQMQHKAKEKEKKLKNDMLHGVRASFRSMTASLENHIAETPKEMLHLNDLKIYLSRVEVWHSIYDHIFSSQEEAETLERYYDLNSFLTPILSKMAEALGLKKEVQFTFELQDIDGIEANHEHSVNFATMLLEMIVNAYKSCQKVDRLTKIEVLIKNEAENLNIIIRDNGEGIANIPSKEELRDGEGGYGLTRSIWMVEDDYEGEFNYYPNHDYGTTFKITDINISKFKLKNKSNG